MDFDTLLNAYLSWDYDAVMASFDAEGTWPPARESDGAPARVLASVAAPIAEHAVWSRTTNENLARLGLSFVPAYMWGRLAPLGDAPPEVLAGAAGSYEPAVVMAVLAAAKRQCGRAGLLAARESATVESLAGILDDAGVPEADVADVAAALRRAVTAADGAGRPLFTAIRAQPWPESPAGQLWRACDLLRERRGDSHVAVWVAHGFSAVAVNLLTELWDGLPLGVYTSLRRGWREDHIAAGVADLVARGLVADSRLTEAGRAARDELEARTDALEQPVLDVLGPDLDRVVEALDRFSGAVVEAGAFPPGTYRPLRASASSPAARP
jgi:hypothetical protein